jgi:hypothetical protein
MYNRILSVSMVLFLYSCIEKTPVQFIDAFHIKSMTDHGDMIVHDDHRDMQDDEGDAIKKMDQRLDTDVDMNLLVMDMGNMVDLPPHTLSVNDQILTCVDGFVDLDGIPMNGCECQKEMEICNFKDDDCDLDVDEERVCADVLARNCEVAFAWNVDDWNNSREGIWDDSFWSNIEAQEQDDYSRIIRTNRDGRLYPISIDSSVIDDYHLFEIDFQCESNSPNMQIQPVLAWMNDHCYFALGLNEGTLENIDVESDEGRENSFMMNVDDCVDESTNATTLNGNFFANPGFNRCVKTKIPSMTDRFSRLQPKSELKVKSMVAINFLCNTTETSTPEMMNYHKNMMESMMVVFGFNSVKSISAKDFLMGSPKDIFQGCESLNNSMDRKKSGSLGAVAFASPMENIFTCVGSDADENTWHSFELGVDLGAQFKYEFFLGLIGVH